MIKEQDLYEAIAECQGEKNPNANTCIKLAAYYMILHNMNVPDINVGNIPRNSYASEPTEKVMYDSGTEFSEVIYGRDIEEILPILDELMETIQVLLPKLYFATIDKLKS